MLLIAAAFVVVNLLVDVLYAVLDPRIFARAWRALRSGFRQSGVKGDPTQLGGVFVIRRGGSLLYESRSRYAGDYPPSEEFLGRLEAEQLATLGATTRTGSQFHWFNRGYGCFDDFLGEFNSRKRKSLRRERRIVAEQGLRLEVMTGPEISDAAWEKFYHFYQLTYAKRSGHGGYLTR
mgnify:CR=1 FL=1